MIHHTHTGDGNLHLNFTTKSFDPAVLQLIEPFLFEETSRMRGSISAEHGIGLFKRDYLHYSKSPAAIENMRAIKRLYDPSGILNPYKVIVTAGCSGV